ncbi:MAG: hypothetical protein ABL952_06140 [Pyrinomonadaceae bacterium]
MKSMDSLYVTWKRLLSYAKSEWDLADYPVRVAELADAEPGTARYYAQILRWNMIGIGDTADAAYDDLRNHFEEFKRDRRADLKRPGVTPPIEFASQDGIERHDQTAERFIDEPSGFHIDG